MKIGRSNISYKRHHSDVNLHSGYELFLSLHRMHVKNTMVEMVLCTCILYVMIRQKKKTSEKENIVCVGEVIITVAIIKWKIKTTATCLMDSVLCLTLSLMVTTGDAVCSNTHTTQPIFLNFMWDDDGCNRIMLMSITVVQWHTSLTKRLRDRRQQTKTTTVGGKY